MANRKDIVKKFAEQFTLTQVRADEYIMAVLDMVHDTAMEDGHTTVGCHKFVKKISKERNGRNPRTGESIVIPQKTKLVYKRLNK
jgi:DNA-binding protein HU-beta